VTGISDKPEFPPLLPGGFHPMTINEVIDLCVKKFPLSTTRQQIVDGLSLIIERLTIEGIVGEIWIDGSFVTEKIDPEDVDFVVRVESDFYDSTKGSQREVLEWIANVHLKETHKSDCYLLVEWPPNNVMYPFGQSERNRWLALFGKDRASQRDKGLILLSLGTDRQDDSIN
jgi:hypothetical protein